MINYMRGSLCVLSEDGTWGPQRPGWSCDALTISTFKEAGCHLLFEQILAI